MSNKLLGVILPCYNEEENIENLIMQWKSEEIKLNNQKVELQIIVVNDGSLDKTRDIVKKMKKSYNNIILIDHDKNKGLGEAINSGIKYVAEDEQFDYACIMDSDCTHEPKYIFNMIDKMNLGYDCIIASRYEKGASVEGLSIFRVVLSYCARIIYTLSLRIPGVKDYTCGFRLYTIESLTEVLKNNNGQAVEESSFACMMELLYKVHKQGFKISEIPFTLKYQLKGGESKMRVFCTMRRSLRTTGKILFSWR